MERGAGVIWGSSSGERSGPVLVPPPPPEPVKPPGPVVSSTPIQVGGVVQSAKLINRTMPRYPPLARQARVQGLVRLEAVIGEDGAIRELRAVSGHPLLIPAALSAVKRWRYRPTLLNGRPVRVITRP